MYFGTLVSHYDAGTDEVVIDGANSHIEGVDSDLVIRPFGRKGEFSSIREFDKGAMMFHFGMQPVEVFDFLVDADRDGIVNEILIGEMSALEIFITTQETPVQSRKTKDARAGFDLFQSIGCADCHVPALTTRDKMLRYAFVPMFSDLKRHDMGPGLAESFAGATDEQNREFITAKLWGVADTAPYLHDGRALTLTEAILAHGGDAQSVRDLFEGLSADDQKLILNFLGTLRTPESPNFDVLN